MTLHERGEPECGHCWAEATGEPDPNPHGQWIVTVCDECDELWPCAAVREVMSVVGVALASAALPGSEIDAVDFQPGGVFKVRYVPKPETVEVAIRAVEP